MLFEVVSNLQHLPNGFEAPRQNGMRFGPATREWQDDLWRRWPTPAEWPGWLTVYEAAAYVRVHHHTIREALEPDRSGRASLAHKKIGGTYRIRKSVLDAWNDVESYRA